MLNSHILPTSSPPDTSAIEVTCQLDKTTTPGIFKLTVTTGGNPKKIDSSMGIKFNEALAFLAMPAPVTRVVISAAIEEDQRILLQQAVPKNRGITVEVPDSLFPFAKAWCDSIANLAPSSGHDL